MDLSNPCVSVLKHSGLGAYARCYEKLVQCTNHLVGWKDSISTISEAIGSSIVSRDLADEFRRDERMNMFRAVLDKQKLANLLTLFASHELVSLPLAVLFALPVLLKDVRTTPQTEKWAKDFVLSGVDVVLYGQRFEDLTVSEMVGLIDTSLLLENDKLSPLFGSVLVMPTDAKSLVLSMNLLATKEPTHVAQMLRAPLEERPLPMCLCYKWEDAVECGCATVSRLVYSVKAQKSARVFVQAK